MRVYRKSEMIFEEGDYASEMFVIHSGKVRLFRTASSEQIEVGLLDAGQFFGEMALADNSPRSASACADEDGTTLISIDRDKFLFLVSHQPAFALVIMHALCERIRSLSEYVFCVDPQNTWARKQSND